MSPDTFKHSADKRAANRERVRRHRAKKRAELDRQKVVSDLLTLTGDGPSGPEDAVDALAAWAKETLIVPSSHRRLAGQPMVLTNWFQSFLRDAYKSQESVISVGRKNGKSAGAAILVLGHLCGPLRAPGFRAAVASISKEKAKTLRDQVEDIARASGLNVLVRHSPYPGSIETKFGIFETLSGDRTAGHSSSFDLVICDETGLLKERDRDFVAGLRSSISAKGGKIIHLSVRGNSPMMGELLENPAVVSHIYEAKAGCALDDREAWAAANPGLADGIKQIEYLERESDRVRGTPGDENSFRALELNQRLNPSDEMICTVDDLAACFVRRPKPLPERLGDAYIGLDIGEATSGTAACAVWPLTGRVELYLAFGDVPDLAARGRRDDAHYLAMKAAGELWTYPGRVVKPSSFLNDLQTALTGSRVRMTAADSYKSSEVSDYFDRARVPWPIEFRRVGAGKDGGHDVRAFQRLVLLSKIRIRESLALVDAIGKSTLRRDTNGNPGLDKARARGRIDVLSAAVIACGLSESQFDKPKRRARGLRSYEIG